MRRVLSLATLGVARCRGAVSVVPSARSFPLAAVRRCPQLFAPQRAFSVAAAPEPTSPAAAASTSDSPSEAALLEEAEFSSPSTASSFRSFVRSRASGLAARAAARGTGPSEWRDSVQITALREEALGGVLRRTIARIQPGRLDEFITWAQEHLGDAYKHEGFRGSYLAVDYKENSVEHLTFWSSEHAANQNTHHAAYRTTMTALGDFIVDSPDTQVRQVVLRIPAGSDTAAAAGSDAAPTTFD